VAAPVRITSAANPLVRQLRELQQARARRERGEFLAEGLRLVGDALQAGARPRQLLVSPELLAGVRGGAEMLGALAGENVVELSDAAFRAIADTETPQGIAALFPIAWARVDEARADMLLVVDGLQDPGNLGTLIRSAVGSGVVGVLAVRGGADPFGPKAVRAAAGALFRCRIARPSDDELAAALAGRAVWLAEAEGGQRYDRIDWRRPCALVIGSEAAGATPELRRLATGRVSIPLGGELESLNAGVAASILLFEAARQLNS
jgi:TrmH family RNA methyltransferase